MKLSKEQFTLSKYDDHVVEIYDNKEIVMNSINLS